MLEIEDKLIGQFNLLSALIGVINIVRYMFYIHPLYYCVLTILYSSVSVVHALRETLTNLKGTLRISATELRKES